MVTKLKKLERIKKIQIIGFGNECPKCSEPMQRRKHRAQPDKTFFYSQWDYCIPCKHVQHYEEFKSGDWKESQRQEEFLNNI